MQAKQSTAAATDPNALQDAILARAAESGEAVSIYLVNGIRIGGRVLAADKYTVLLSNRIGSEAPQLVAAISTVAPELTGR